MADDFNRLLVPGIFGSPPGNGLGPSTPTLNLDDIIRQYLAMPTQNNTAVQYQPYPGSGARVPPDKLLDAPVVVYDPPPIEDQTNPYIQYDDAPAPVVAPNKDITMNKAIRRNEQLANLPNDLRALLQMLQQPSQ